MTPELHRVHTHSDGANHIAIEADMKKSAAEIVREDGPLPGIDAVHGLTYDGQNVWFASGNKLNALDPTSGKTIRSIDVAAHAGAAFDGTHLYQIAENQIHKVDPNTGRVLATIPAPGNGGEHDAAVEGADQISQDRGRRHEHSQFQI